MIRPFQQGDTSTLIDVFNLNVPEYFDPKELQEFVNYLSIRPETYLTLEVDNKIIGGVGYEIRQSDKSGRINWIFIHPDFKGGGYGKLAVEYCLSIMTANPDVELLVIRTSQLAFAFFEQFGYKVTIIEKEYWGPGLDLYVMEKRNKPLAP